MTDGELTKVAWTFRKGDTWGRTHICVDPGSPAVVIDPDTLLMQIRSNDGTLLVSTGAAGEAEGVVAAEFTDDTSLDGDELVVVWTTGEADTDVDSIVEGMVAWFELEATVEGSGKQTIIPRRRAYFVDQIART